jgi:hypothetical membrane protein
VDRRLVVLACLTVVGQSAYHLGWLIAGPLQHGYSAANNFVSDLGADSSADPWVMNVAFGIFGLSFFTLAAALRRSLPPSSARAVAVLWFAAFGATFVAATFLHEDCWSGTSHLCWARQQAGLLSWHHYAHVGDSRLIAVFAPLSPLVLFAALPRGPLRIGCGVCAALSFAAFVGITLATRPIVGFPKSGLGLEERIEAGVISGWVLAIVAAMLVAAAVPARGRA